MRNGFPRVLRLHRKQRRTTKLNFLAAGIFLTALSTGFGQSAIQFSASTYTVAENAGSVIFTVQRTGDTNAVVSVDYASANGTAMAGSDYTATNGTLTFAAGETNQTIAVPILNDGIVESTADETFTVTLSNPTNAVLGTRTIANVRITDNDKGLQLGVGYPRTHRPRRSAARAHPLPGRPHQELAERTARLLPARVRGARH